MKRSLLPFSLLSLLLFAASLGFVADSRRTASFNSEATETFSGSQKSHPGGNGNDCNRRQSG